MNEAIYMFAPRTHPPRRLALGSEGSILRWDSLSGFNSHEGWLLSFSSLLDAGLELVEADDKVNLWRFIIIFILRSIHRLWVVRIQECIFLGLIEMGHYEMVGRVSIKTGQLLLSKLVEARVDVINLSCFQRASINLFHMFWIEYRAQKEHKFGFQIWIFVASH